MGGARTGAVAPAAALTRTQGAGVAAAAYPHDLRWPCPRARRSAGLGNLFTAYGDFTSNTLPFVDVQPGYWSGTEFAPGSDAWFFLPAVGVQSIIGERLRFFAVAVRPGDVAAPVPEPQTLALALLALGATVVARRRRPH